MRRIVTVACLVLGAVGPASADPVPALPARAADAAARSGAVAERLTGASIAEAVAATAGLRGASVRGASVPAPAGAQLVGRATSLARTLRDAGLRARTAVRADPEDLAAAHGELRSLIATQPDRSARVAWDRYEARWGHLRDEIDAPAIAGQALRSTEAIESALPILRTLGARPGPAAGSGCDVADDAPLLCVGGEGSNTYTAEYVLTLDLGGDDTYLTSAGGADATFPAATVLDLGGNDTYRSPPPRFAQGSSNIGIGILVDASGDDVYETRQGQAIGFAGAGILADLAGNDRYTLTNDDPGGAVDQPFGQGYAVFGALGLALDAGGDDTYLISARPATPIVNSDGSLVSIPGSAGFGLGAFAAAGVSFDAGGTDTFRVLASSAPVAATEARAVDLRSSTLAFGVGIGPFGGAGLHASGPGDTVRILDATSTGPRVAYAFTNGLGYGIGDGIGAIVDAAGDDLYEAHATAVARADVTWSDGCTCDEDAIASSGVPAIGAMGYGALAGAGVQLDLQGDDRYAAETLAGAHLRLHDARAGVPELVPEGYASAGYSQIQAQGSSLLGGSGYVEDALGEDDYSSIARAESSAESSSAVGAPPTVHAFSGSATYVQAVGGVGYGELRDLGGTDRFTAMSLTNASTSPQGDEIENAYTSAQASVIGLLIGDPEQPGGVAPAGAATFLDVDGGALDTFVTVPADPTCLGTRGGPAWVDCDGSGIGANL